MISPKSERKELDVEGAMNELVRLVIFRRVSTRVLVEDILQRLKIACYNEGYGDGYENAKENYTPPMGTRE